MCGRFSVLNRRFSVLLSYGARAGKQVTTEKASSHKKDVKKRKKKKEKKRKKKERKKEPEASRNNRSRVHLLTTGRPAPALYHLVQEREAELQASRR